MKKERSQKNSTLPLAGKEIVLGICGGIAAYKMPEFVRLLRKQGAGVTCILTENGARFVTPLTLQTVSGNRVYTDMFDTSVWDIEHIALADKADLVIVAPATADAISRFAAGRAEDLLASVVLAARSPILVCPAMNERMWRHPATRSNVRRCVEYGYRFVDPADGELACGSTGPGRLAPPDAMLSAVSAILRS